MDMKVKFWNLRKLLREDNDNLGGTPQDTPQDKIMKFCLEERTKIEIASHCGYKDIKHFTDKYLKPMLESGLLKMTIPDKPNSKNQKYILSERSKETMQ